MRTKTKILLICTASLLAACPTQREWAESLAGSWQGEKGQDSWCLSLQGKGTSEKGEGAAVYRSIYRAGGEKKYFHAEGIWFVGVGGRLQVNLNPLQLDESLNPLPPTDIKTESWRYLVKSLGENQLVYHEHKPNGEFGEIFESARVEHCDNYFSAQHE